MKRTLPLFLILLLAGCPDEPPPGGVVPDDDDTTVANDDDTTVDDDDATTDDDDSGDDDDDDSGDDDDSTPDGDGDDDSAGDDDDSAGDDDDSAPVDCGPDVQLGPGCAAIPFTPLFTGGGAPACPPGPYQATSAVEWAALLSSCGVVGDPLVGHDWATESVLGFVDAGSGCSAVAEITWAVSCAGRHHINESFATCGECDAVPSAGAWISVPTSTLPLQSRFRCQGAGFGCEE